MSTVNGRPSAIHAHPAVRSRPSRLLRPFELERLVRSLAATDDLWRSIVCHTPRQRWYTRVHWTSHVEVWLLGWDVGQDTRLHDHGGSCGAFCVADGQLWEQHGRAGGARLRVRAHAAGSAASFDTAYVHNLLDGGRERATSVHAYSPPLSIMRFYEPNERGRLVAAYQLPVAGPEPDDRAAPTPLGRLDRG
jgi:hypothetical protein